MRGIFIALASRPMPAMNRLMLGTLACVGYWVNDLEASPFNYNLGYRAEYSDNITRIPSERDAQSELINTVNAGFSYLENTGTVNTRVLANVAYNQYYHETFENQTTLSLNAYGEAFFVQRTLSWVATDSFQRLQIDPLLPDTPTNQQNSNAWVTGPNAYLRLGAVDTVIFEGRYGQSWVENLDIDNDRYSYAARWVHRISTRSILSLNYEYLDVDYENDTLNSDLSRHNYFLRASVIDARTRFTFDLGRTRIEREGFTSVDDWLIHMTASMQAATTSLAGLSYRREYSDTGGELLSSSTDPSQGPAMPILGTDVVTSEPFYLHGGDLFYTYRGVVVPWTMRAFYRDIDYQISPTDRQEWGVTFDARYLYSSSVYFQLFGSYSVLSFDQLLREDQDSNVGLSFAYRMTPNLQAALEVRRFGRRSTVINQDYIDNRAALTLIYGSSPAGH